MLSVSAGGVPSGWQARSSGYPIELRRTSPGDVALPRALSTISLPAPDPHAPRPIAHRDGGGMNVGATLFFLFLVSILVSMFDHYRPIYLRRVEAEHALA